MVKPDIRGFGFLSGICDKLKFISNNYKKEITGILVCGKNREECPERC